MESVGRLRVKTDETEVRYLERVIDVLDDSVERMRIMSDEKTKRI